MKDRVAKSPGRYSAQVSPEDFNNLQTGKAFPITLVRDDDPEVEGTPYSKAAVLPDSIAEVLCPGVEDPTPADAFAALVDLGKNKPQVYAVTPDTLADVIKSAMAGAVIQLTPGAYGRIDLHGQNAYPEDCTFIGCEGATVAGVSITSGVISDTLQASADISDAILPQGLTFKDFALSDSFCLRNARIDNLTLDNISLGENTNISISPECFVDAYGDDRFSEPKGNGSMYRFPYAHLKQKNLVIRDCKLADSTGTPQYEDGQASAINVVGVDGVTIYHNETNGGYNGIQVGGQITDYGVLSCGKVSITKNTVKNTTTRGINVHSICDGDVTIAENALESINHDDKIIVRYCDNTTLTWDVWGENEDYSKPNTCDGKAVYVGSGIVVSNSVSLPSEYYASLTAGVLMYSGSRDENEDKLNSWLDNTVLPSMANDTIRNVSIRCGGANGLGNGIIPWPAMGTIHKHTEKYATIDVTTQIHGKHYTKVRGDTGWQSTVCETDKLNAKANKTDVAPAGYGLGENCIYVETIDEITKNGYYKFEASAGHETGTYVCHAVVNGNIIHLTGWLNGYILHRTKSGGVWGKWEWENPPMQPSQEYRTTERYEGKPVYAKLLYFGSLPNATYRTVKPGITNCELIIHCAVATSNGILLPYLDKAASQQNYQMYVRVAGIDGVTIYGQNDYSHLTATVLLKYTKTTD